MVAVFLVAPPSLLSEGIEHTLRREPGLEIVGQESCEAQVLESIRKLKPDVVIAARTDAAPDAGLFAHLVRAGVTATFIELSLDTNGFTVCRGECRGAGRLEDLVDAIRKSESQELAGKTTKIVDRIAAEPAYRTSLYKLLMFCATPRTAAEVDKELCAWPEMGAALHPPQALLAWLVQAGGIEQLAAAQDGPQWQTTEAGRKAVELHGPAERLVQLLAREPACHDLYSRVLAFCLTPRARTEIEALVQDDPILAALKVYPSFLIEGLEAAGGLEWVGKWRTTDAGKTVAGGGDTA